jgi:uncharacterized membrane protein (UPF0127 family)
MAPNRWMHVFGRGHLALAILAVALASTAAPGCRRHAHQGGAQGVPARKADAQGLHAQSSGAAETSRLSPPAATPAVSIRVGPRDVLFHVQVAATPEEHANGLIGRPSLASDAGLLFVFARPGLQTLRMKDTLIPIDIIFIGADRRIVGIIEKAQPLTATERRIALPSQYVLEIGGGLSSRLGLQVGQSVELRAIPGT